MPSSEPVPPIEGSAPIPPPVARRDWMDVTVRLATSWVGLFAAYVAALILAIAKFKEYTTGLHELGLPPWSAVALIAAFPLFALVFSTIPSIIDQQRIKRYGEIKVDVRAGYFTLRPRETEEGFERVDQAHETILSWIKTAKQPVLYITGASGTGKSSLLAAWVIPKLRREGHVVIQVRGYDQIFERIKEEVLEGGVIWVKPPERETDLRILLKRACDRLGQRRLIIIVDQFEEFLILKDEQQQRSFQQFLSETSEGPTFLLVYRPEYEGLIQDQAWPRMQLDTNRRVISAFTENAANEFLRKSGLTLNQDLKRKVLREAAEIEQGAVGLIRPVTINLCGLVLSRFSGGLPQKFRGGIIRGFLRESLALPEVRDVAEGIVPNLITDNVTKRPRSIAELAQATQLAPVAVRACMRRLGESDRAIVRPLDDKQEVWEISHDFLVPLLDAIIIRRTSSLWRRARPWLPWVATMGLGIFAVVSPVLRPDFRTALNKQGWEISENNGVLSLTRYTPIPQESVPVLRSIPLHFSIGFHSLDLNDTRGMDLSALKDLKDLKSLTSLSLYGLGVTDVSALKDLKSLTSLDLGGTRVADVSALKDLKNLTSLDLGLTGVKDLSALKDLNNLTSLNLSDTWVMDVSALKDLKSLTFLDLRHTRVTDISALKDLKNLTFLNLSDTEVTDVSALKDMKGLTSLDLRRTRVTDVSALKDLKSLTSLNLGDAWVIDLSALKDLKSLRIHH